ncbi:MAG: undecaprenyl-diphosphate phosphatase [Brevinematia bacterium]
MDFIKAILLGIVEGFTEFLPISSTGHLILLNQFLSFERGFEKTFDIFIQLGAILSVVFYFWHRLNPFEKNKEGKQRQETYNLWLKTLIAVIPSIVIGALFGGLIQKFLFNPIVVAIMLLLGGLVMILLEMRNSNFKYYSINQLDYKICILIGLFQCLSFIPGTSRSAATIIGAMFLGLSRGIAVEFSFFLALPTMLMATGYSILKTGFNITLKEWGLLITGFVTSFIVAYFIISFFINFIRKHNFVPFAVYRIILGLAIIIYFLIKK